MHNPFKQPLAHFRPNLSEPTYAFTRLVIPAIIIGIGSGLGAVAFRKMITFFTWFFFHAFHNWASPIAPFNTILAPVLGALIFGPMIWKWAREARGHGVPEVMEAVALKGGRIRPVVAVVKSLASSIDIGSGGAIGREGPIAQIGSALGSTLGQAFKLPPRYLRLLVVAGASGGISATFNAPIAGALFGMEVILHEFTAESFAAVGIGAVVADMVSIPFLGTKPFFVLPATVGTLSPWALVGFAVVGLIAALIGTGFTSGLYKLEDLFNEWKFHEAFKPAAGAVLLGILIALVPNVRGLGYGVMAQAFELHYSLGILVLLLFGKFLASVLTLGSGGSGGIFTPTLFMGAMLGGALGIIFHHMAPGLAGSPAAYALVGTAAVFSASARAPITAVIIVMEMSQNYTLAIPLLLSTLIATHFADMLLRDSIYTLKLVRRGVRIFQQTQIDVLQQMTVKEAMTTAVPVISPDEPVAQVAQMMSSQHWSALPVAQGDKLIGIVTVGDLERVPAEPPQPLPISTVTVNEVIVAYPDESLRDALMRMSRSGVGQLLVVDPEMPTRFMGILRRVDVISAIERQTGTTEMPKESWGDTPTVPGGTFYTLRVPMHSPNVHQTLKDLSFPAGVIVVAIRRGKSTIVPRGNTEIMPDDQVLLYLSRPELKVEVNRFMGIDTAPLPSSP